MHTSALILTVLVAMEAAGVRATDLDTDLRARLRTFVASDEYQQAETTGEIECKLGRLLQATVREHWAKLPALVKQDLEALPKVTSSRLPDLISTTGADFFNRAEVERLCRNPGPASERGAAFYCLFFLPSRAALQGVQAFQARQYGPLQNSKRSVVAHLAPPKLFCLEDDPKAPVLVVDAVDGTFVVYLVGLADGLFIPTRIEHRKSMIQPSGAANGSQPIRSGTGSTSSAAGSRR